MVDLVPNARQQFLDVNQSPLVGGMVFMYVPNTTIPKATWADQAGTIPNPNPIILDAVGSAAIWGQGLYRQVVEDSLGNVIWDALTNPPGELNATGTNAGCVVWFAASAPPGGFLECNGAAVSRATYNLLFAAVGTTWGAGDGTSTFNVPDLRGYFIRAWADTGTIDSGRVFGSTQTDATNQANLTGTIGSLAGAGSITGTLTLPGSPGAGVGAESGGQNIGKDGTYTVTVPTGALNATVTLSGAPGITAQMETRPVNVALLPCISTGAGPGNTNGGTLVLGVTEVNHALSPYTLLPTDTMLLCNPTGGPIIINPPANPVLGQVIYIKDVFGLASIIDYIEFSFTIDGIANPKMTAPYDARTIAFTGPWSFLT